MSNELEQTESFDSELDALQKEQQILEELERDRDKLKHDVLQSQINVGKGYLRIRGLVGHSYFLDYLQQQDIDLQEAQDDMRIALSAAIASTEGKNENE